LFSLALLPTVYLIVRSSYLYGDLGLKAKYVYELGMGNPSGLFLFGAQSAPYTLAAQYRGMILASLPQLYLSYIFFIYNDHITCMIAARDYSEFAQGKRGLRVSYPEKNTAQKSTYFLAVPLIYAILLNAFQATLHYLASQSIFWARVDMLDHYGMPQLDMSLNQVGYSVLGLIMFAAVASVGACIACCLGLRRLPEGMPLAASCSAAISAACHPTHTDRHYVMEIMWGVDVDEHCSFTSGAVQKPREGVKYA
jgi:hypothetical protein